MNNHMMTTDRRRSHDGEIGPVLAPCMDSVDRRDDSGSVWLRVLGYWGPVALYAGFIFYLSSQSSFPDTLPTFVEKLGDKAHHMMAYGIFGLLWYRAFRWSAGPWAASRAVILAIVAATVYGVTDELHQWFVPLRESDPWDLMADMAGAAVAVVAWHWWMARR
jgi:VanZ family protein